MHEMSIVSRFANMAIEEARQRNAVKVRQVVVQVGEMTDIVPYYLQKYYPIAVEGTILEGSALAVEVIPLQVSCNDCGEIYNPMKTPERLCPVCHSGNCHILAGRDIYLKEILIEEET